MNDDKPFQLLNELHQLFIKKKQFERKWESEMELILSQMDRLQVEGLKSVGLIVKRLSLIDNDDDRYHSDDMSLKDIYKKKEQISSKFIKLKSSAHQDIEVFESPNKTTLETKIHITPNLTLRKKIVKDPRKCDNEGTYTSLNTCALCGMKFISNEGLKNHSRRYHEVTKTYDISNSYFDNQIKEELEINEIDDPDQECRKDIESDVYALRVSKTDNKTDPSFLNDESTQCNYCVFNTKESSNLKRHIQNMHENEPQICPHCDYSTRRAQSLDHHVDFYHNKIFKYSCKFCDYRALDSSKLGLHTKTIHDKIKDKLCPKCPAKFSSSSNRQDHIKCVHEKTMDKRCDKCLFKTNKTFLLKEHMNTHEDE